MYLSWRVRQFGGAATSTVLAHVANDAMPAYCAWRVQDLSNDRSKPLRGSTILVVGVAHKADIGDMRESPALPLLEARIQRGAEVACHDPHVASLRLAGGELVSVEPDDDRLATTDCAIVVTAHSSIDYKRIAMRAPLVFDTRNVVPRRDGVFIL